MEEKNNGCTLEKKLFDVNIPKKGHHSQHMTYRVGRYPLQLSLFCKLALCVEN